MNVSFDRFLFKFQLNLSNIVYYEIKLTEFTLPHFYIRSPIKHAVSINESLIKIEPFLKININSFKFNIFQILIYKTVPWNTCLMLFQIPLRENFPRDAALLALHYLLQGVTPQICTPQSRSRAQLRLD